MSIKAVKTITLPNLRKLELSVNDEGKVLKVEGFINDERVWTNLLAYPISEDEALEKFKGNFEV
jgi:hypothetical protein